MTLHQLSVLSFFGRKYDKVVSTVFLTSMLAVLSGCATQGQMEPLSKVSGPIMASRTPAVQSEPTKSAEVRSSSKKTAGPSVAPSTPLKSIDPLADTTQSVASLEAPVELWDRLVQQPARLHPAHDRALEQISFSHR